MASNGFIAFMQGITGAGLFTRLRRPGAPTEFIDSRTLEEYLDSGELEETLIKYRQDSRHSDPEILGLYAQVDPDLRKGRGQIKQ
jgi:hypothetical protein